MKKILSLAVLAFLSVFTVMAQGEQFVSTEVSNKNVVLEEYTGINCGYCPDGHRIANEIAAAHPGRVFPINIHVGSYAANTYTTQFGTSLMNQTGLTGFPAGTVNRHVFSGSNTILDRGNWSARCNTILDQTSPVNIAARGTLNWATHELNITVQLYYTADEANATNKLNIAVIQDSVLGPQANGSTYNPSQMVGNQYRHMHMLRHLITGQWGDDITTTTQGTFVEKTYTYTIPGALGSPNAIAAPLKDLHFIAFVAQGHQEILTACEVEIENIIPSITPSIDAITYAQTYDCSGEIQATIAFSNLGTENITSLTIEYGASDNLQTTTWTGDLAPNASTTFQLPVFPITTNTDQEIVARIINANGQDIESFDYSLTVKKIVAEGTATMNLRIKADQYSAPYSGNSNGEQSYKLYGPNNQVIQQANGTDFTASTVNTFPINLTENGCYRLQVKDSYGDGISGGYIRVYDSNNTMIININGTSFTTEVNAMIYVGNVNIDDEALQDMFVFPNPATELINIEGSANIQQVELYNLQGQRVAMEMGNVRTLSLNGLANGMYIMKVTTDNGTSTYKVSKR